MPHDAIKILSQELFAKRGAIPRGTTDITMAKLFPEKRSEVDYSPERVKEVWDILEQYGVVTEESHRREYV